MHNKRNFGFSCLNPFIFSCLLVSASLSVSVQASASLFKAVALSVLMVSGANAQCPPYTPLDDATIRTAVADYLAERPTAEYGPTIGDWCTGDVTDMSYL